MINSKTTLGYTLTQPINSGLVNHDSDIGIYDRDEESYSLFSELFDQIIEDYHGFGKNDKHKRNFNIEDIDIKNPDTEGK